MFAFAAGNADEPTALAPSERRSFRFALVAITLAALGLRLFRLGAESLWMDELVTVESYYYPPSQIVLKAADLGQPPLDNFIGAALVRAGLSESDWWIRFPAALFGAGGVLLLGVLGCRLGGSFAGLIAALLLAVCPLHMYMSQEARPYTLFFFLALAAALLYLRADRLNTLAAWVCFAFTLLAMLMTRWVDPHFVTAGLVLYVVAQRAMRFPVRTQRNARLLKPLAALLFAYAVYAPFFLIIFNRSRGAVAAQSSDGLHRLSEQLYQSYAALFAGYSTRTLFTALPVGAVLLTVGTVLCTVGLAVLCRRAQAENPGRGVFLTTILPFPFLYAITFALMGNAVPKPQYLLFGAALVFPVIGIGVVAVGRALQRRHGALGYAVPALACLFLASRMALASGQSAARIDKQDWRGVMNYLREHSSAADAFATIAADTVPPVFHVAPYGRARYGPANAKFMNVTLAGSPTLLDQGPWERYTNTVWVLGYTDRMYRGVDVVTPPAAIYPDMEVHAFEGLFLLELRGAGLAADRFRNAVAAIYRELPPERSLVAPAFFLGQRSLMDSAAHDANHWFEFARLQCRGDAERAALEGEWIGPALAKQSLALNEPVARP